MWTRRNFFFLKIGAHALFAHFWPKSDNDQAGHILAGHASMTLKHNKQTLDMKYSIWYSKFLYLIQFN